MYNLDAVNSATKYPSIPTYHKLVHGILEDEAVQFDSTVYFTEKVDGTNARIILMPDGDWFIASRSEILTAYGDRVYNPAQDIVKTLLSLADRVEGDDAFRRGKVAQVFYLEVYGGRIGAAAKNYSRTGAVGYRMFDIAFVPVEAFGWSIEKIAFRRDEGTLQVWATEHVLQRASEAENIPLVPRLGSMDAEKLPGSGRDGIRNMQAMLEQYTPITRVGLDTEPYSGGDAEGIVLRTSDRQIIAKARFEDYRRTMKKRNL